MNQTMIDCLHGELCVRVEKEEGSSHCIAESVVNCVSINITRSRNFIITRISAFSSFQSCKALFYTEYLINISNIGNKPCEGKQNCSSNGEPHAAPFYFVPLPAPRFMQYVNIGLTGNTFYIFSAGDSRHVSVMEGPYLYLFIKSKDKFQVLHSLPH